MAIAATHKTFKNIPLCIQLLKQLFVLRFSSFVSN